MSTLTYSASERCWPRMAMLLMASCAAQQIGASALVLLLLRTLLWDSATLSSFWALAGVSLFFVPLFGAISDAAAAASPATKRRRPHIDDESTSDASITCTADMMPDPSSPPSDSLPLPLARALLRRRERFLALTCVIAAVCSGAVWWTCRHAVRTLRLEESSTTQAPPQSNRETMSLWDFPVIVTATLALTVTQSLQNAAINGWLVDAATTFGCSTVTTQSWAMTRRSVGSLGGALMETVLFGLQVVVAPESMLFVCAALQLTGCIAMFIDDVTMFHPVESCRHKSAASLLFRTTAPHHMVEHRVCLTVVARCVVSIFASVGEFLCRVWFVCRSRFAALERRDGSAAQQGHHRALLVALAVVFFLNALPSPGAAYFAYVAQTLHYPNWMLALNGAVGLAAALAAVNVFQLTAAAGSSDDDKSSYSCDTDVQQDHHQGHPHDTSSSKGCTDSQDGHPKPFSLNGNGREKDEKDVLGALFDVLMIRSIGAAGAVACLSTLSNLILIYGQGFMGPTLSQAYLLADEAVMAFGSRWAYMPMLVLGARVAGLGNSSISAGSSVASTHQLDDAEDLPPPPPPPPSSSFTFELFAVASSVGAIVSNWLSSLLIRATMHPPAPPLADSQPRLPDPTGSLAFLVCVCVGIRIVCVAVAVVSLWWMTKSPLKLRGGNSR